MRGVDIIVVLDLVRRRSADWTVRSVAVDLGLPPAAVQRAVSRLASTPVLDARTRRVNRTEVEHLLIDAARFMFPARLGSETRGVPTAWGSRPLADQLAPGDGSPVWPSATGQVRGFALEPLHEAAIGLSETRPELYELLTLVDALRVGDTRIRSVAAGLLRTRLNELPTP